MKWSDNLNEGLRISIAAIGSNKLRSSLTTLGIVIGVATVSLMGAAISGIQNTFAQSLSALGSDVLFIQRFSWGPSKQEWWRMRNRRSITLRDAKRFQRELTMARAVSIETSASAKVEYEDRSASSVPVVGKSEQSAIVSGLSLQAGRFFTAGEVNGARPVCVMGADLAKNLFPQGSPLGNRIRIGDRKFKVIGVLEVMGQFMFQNLDNQVMIPITRFASDFAHNPDVTISVKVLNPDLINDAEVEVRGIMRKIRRLPPGKEDDFGVNRQDLLLDAFNKGIATIATGGLFITGLSLFVGGIGIMNIMFVSVVERTQEIGIRKALGARRRTILVQFLLEAAIICLLGGVMGLAVSYPVTLVMKHYMPASMSPLVVAVALGVSIFTGLVSGYLPALRAARMRPVDALRQE